MIVVLVFTSVAKVGPEFAGVSEVPATGGIAAPGEADVLWFPPTTMPASPFVVRPCEPPLEQAIQTPPQSTPVSS